MKPSTLFATPLIGLLLSLALTSVAPLAQAIEAGKEYSPVVPAQPTETRGKIEVTEFFWYRCPHCMHFEPDLKAWAAKLPKDVVLRRQPAILGESWAPMARAYYTLETLGAVGRLHDEVFDAVQNERINLNDPETFFDWAAKQGLERTTVQATYESFGVNMQVERARQISRAYRLNGVPAMAVNGKFMTSASQAGGQEEILAVVDALIDQERKRRAAGRR